MGPEKSVSYTWFATVCATALGWSMYGPAHAGSETGRGPLDTANTHYGTQPHGDSSGVIDGFVRASAQAGLIVRVECDESSLAELIGAVLAGGRR